MNDPDLIARLEADATEIDLLANAMRIVDSWDGKTRLQRMRDGQQGHPAAARYDGDPSAPQVQVMGQGDDGWRPMISDPTGEAAIRRDRAAQARRELDKAVTRLHQAIEREAFKIAGILNGYGPPRAASIADRAALQRANIKPDPGCTSCARLESSKGVKRWEPVFRNDRCRWCSDWVRTVGRLPTKKELQAHHDGKRVSHPAA